MRVAEICSLCSASRPEPSPEASPDIVDAWAPPTSHAMGSSGGSFGSSAGSFTFNDQLLIPTSSLGPALNGFAKSASVPLSSAGGCLEIWLQAYISPLYFVLYREFVTGFCDILDIVNLCYVVFQSMAGVL